MFILHHKLCPVHHLPDVTRAPSSTYLHVSSLRGQAPPDLPAHLGGAGVLSGPTSPPRPACRPQGAGESETLGVEMMRAQLRLLRAWTMPAQLRLLRAWRWRLSSCGLSTHPPTLLPARPAAPRGPAHSLRLDTE